MPRSNRASDHFTCRSVFIQIPKDPFWQFPRSVKYSDSTRENFLRLYFQHSSVSLCLPRSRWQDGSKRAYVGDTERAVKAETAEERIKMLGPWLLGLLNKVQRSPPQARFAWGKGPLPRKNEFPLSNLATLSSCLEWCVGDSAGARTLTEFKAQWLGPLASYAQHSQGHQVVTTGTHIRSMKIVC